MKIFRRESKVRQITYVIIGSALLSAAVVLFLTPANLYSAGVTGLAQIILNIVSNIAKIKIADSWLGVLNFIGLLPFVWLAYKTLNFKCALYTFISVIVQTAILAFLPLIIPSNLNLLGEDILGKALVAGFIGGVGNAMVLTEGGTSGGFIVLCQYFSVKKGKQVGSINLIVSAVIVTCAFLLDIHGKGIDIAIYTIISYVASSLVIDALHKSYNNVKIEVISEKGEEIALNIISRFNHGATITLGRGVYTHNQKEIISICVLRYELESYYKVIREIDPKAFISVSPVLKIFGNFNKNVIK